jgi:hypothetical protein
MYSLIPDRLRVMVLVFVIVGLFFLLVPLNIAMVADPAEWTTGDILKVAGWEASILAVVSGLLSFEPIWGFVAKPKLLRALGQPPLLGEWEGTVESNYARLCAIRDAAKSLAESRVDADSTQFLDQVPLLVRPANLKIVGSLWHIKVIVRTEKASDNHPGLGSTSVTARAVRNGDGSISIWYVYDALLHGEPSGNDEESHRGAAVLTVFPDGTARGEYWNERNWRKGMNLAGRMFFKHKALSRG